MSKPLTFKEVPEGATFIAFPRDGDDSGHGGFRQGSHLFTKLRLTKGSKEENAMRNNDGTLVAWKAHREVYLIT
jgi:hypothetical protein